MDILAELARSGCNVILTIHQPRPDVFRLMDSVLLMSGNGQVIALCSSTIARSFMRKFWTSPGDRSHLVHV